jgi:hypothetical protein
MTTIKSPVSVAASICGLNHLQAAALEAAFQKAHRRGDPPGDLLKIVAQHVEAARASAGNPYAAKLSPLQAAQIRRARAQGASYAELGRDFGVSSQSVKRVCLGLSYPAAKSAKRSA